MAGYSGTPLWQKIGVSEGARVALFGAPKHLPKLMKGAPPHDHVLQDADIVWLFCTDPASLATGLPGAMAACKAGGMVWVSWPKKTSALHAGLDEPAIRAALSADGFVDVKVCTVDDDWSGLKFVEHRP